MTYVRIDFKTSFVSLDPGPFLSYSELRLN